MTYLTKQTLYIGLQIDLKVSPLFDLPVKKYWLNKWNKEVETKFLS